MRIVHTIFQVGSLQGTQDSSRRGFRIFIVELFKKSPSGPQHDGQLRDLEILFPCYMQSDALRIHVRSSDLTYERA